LEKLGFPENLIKILESVATEKITVREIGRRTGIRQSHIHTYLNQLRLRGVVEETKFRPKLYGLSVEGLTKILNEKKEFLKKELTRLERFDSAAVISSLHAVEEEIESVAYPPSILSNTKEFHDKAAYILNESKEVIIGTSRPFPWTDKYQLHKNPHHDTKDYWEAHELFLEESRKRKGDLRLTYLVNLDRFINHLNSKETEPAQRAGSIKAILDCLKMIKNGYSLDFICMNSEGTKLSLTTFVVGRDRGLFAISMADGKELVLYGLFLQHPVLAELYGEYVDMLQTKYGESPKDRLKKILRTTLTRVNLPPEDIKEFERELHQMDD